MESRSKIVLFSLFVIIPLLVTFMASPLIIKNEEMKVIMYMKWQPQILTGYGKDSEFFENRQKEMENERELGTEDLNCTWPKPEILNPPGPMTALASK